MMSLRTQETSQKQDKGIALIGLTLKCKVTQWGLVELKVVSTRAIREREVKVSPVMLLQNLIP
jgi:hypothetical protein